MSKIKLAINGFGRIGRASLKIALNNDVFEIVAINDLSNPRVLAHLLKYDTVYGVYEKDVYLEQDGTLYKVSDYRGEKDFFTKEFNENYLIVGPPGNKIKIFAQKDPSLLPWGDLDIDVVLECTGYFTTKEAALKHIEAGAKKVVISAPSKDEETQTLVLGVNDTSYNNSEVVSNASCTTNCVAPVISVLHSRFKILKSFLSTVHAVTSNQNIVDGPPNPIKPDLRRARAGAWNMFPTSTGAAKATTKAIPDLKDMFDGIAIRVPLMTGSLTDLTCLVEKKTTVEEVNQAFIDASSNPIYKNVLSTTYEPIVSSDIIKSKYSSIVDLNLTKVIDGDFIKVLAWYDNEWGYSNRLVEMAQVVN